jgi:hypothetical protein
MGADGFLFMTSTAAQESTQSPSQWYRGILPRREGGWEVTLTARLSSVKAKDVCTAIATIFKRVHGVEFNWAQGQH